MSTERNKKAVRRYVQAMNAGDFETLKSLFAPSAVIHGVVGRGSLDFALPIWRELHDSLQLHLTIDALSADHDMVAARYTETGKFVKPFRGFPGVAPTGKSYTLVAMEWFTFDPQGHIISRHGARDSVAQARQLDVPLAQERA